MTSTNQSSQNTLYEIPFVVVGHVDSGKSTNCGHLLKLCGFVNDHQMAEIEKTAIEDKMERCKFARVLDIYPEEQKKGKHMTSAISSLITKGKSLF